MSDPLLVEAASPEDIPKLLTPHLPEKDPGVMKALIAQDGRSEGEYFTLYVSPIPEGDVVFFPSGDSLQEMGHF